MELYKCLGDFECYTVDEDGYSTRNCYLIKIDSLWEYKGKGNYPGVVRLDRVVDNGKVLSINEPDSILIREFVFSTHFTQFDISKIIENEKKYQECDKYYSDLINHIILFAKSKFSYFREQADICHETANDAYTIQLRDDYITRANCYGEMIRLIEKYPNLSDRISKNNNVITNGDAIRNMSDEELAELFEYKCKIPKEFGLTWIRSKVQEVK